MELGFTRRGKSGVEPYGDTPPMVWKAIEDYLQTVARDDGELMFVTVKGMPVVHQNADSIKQWWRKLRKGFEKDATGLGGFCVLRHLGATEFGSRPGCSIGAMKRWLGHSASSDVAGVYMRPIAPEYRAVIEWVREALRTGEASFTDD